LIDRANGDVSENEKLSEYDETDGDGSNLYIGRGKQQDGGKQKLLHWLRPEERIL